MSLCYLISLAFVYPVMRFQRSDFFDAISKASPNPHGRTEHET